MAPGPAAAEAPGPAGTRPDAFSSAVARLSHRSVQSHADAYRDVDWDGPGMAVDPADERFRLWEVDPLAQTECGTAARHPRSGPASACTGWRWP